MTDQCLLTGEYQQAAVELGRGDRTRAERLVAFAGMGKLGVEYRSFRGDNPELCATHVVAPPAVAEIRVGGSGAARGVVSLRVVGGRVQWQLPTYATPQLCVAPPWPALILLGNQLYLEWSRDCNVTLVGGSCAAVNEWREVTLLKHLLRGAELPLVGCYAHELQRIGTNWFAYCNVGEAWHVRRLFFPEPDQEMVQAAWALGKGQVPKRLVTDVPLRELVDRDLNWTLEPGGTLMIQSDAPRLWLAWEPERA